MEASVLREHFNRLGSGSRSIAARGSKGIPPGIKRMGTLRRRDPIERLLLGCVIELNAQGAIDCSVPTGCASYNVASHLCASRWTCELW